ncbi:BNR-4 repeat-containing protein [Paenibacillus sp. Soil787]|uniref:BNR-4 repeat-containing protein n=1 Tax=Paenibacillus sp. Soil787 TaxID=1736411 RepID=UPI0006FE5169|nr:BNR-4 repeat-containing protein [Paenibacillus sp. Soil787]KRF43684.1 hypothetical protein ASG93_01830 [Paenibacillus sp. Soil787]
MQIKPYQIAVNGSFGCQRPIGAGYFDPNCNQTFVAWNGPEMDVYVRSFHHDDHVWGQSIKVIANGMTGTWDYHNYPGMVQAPDGRPLIFYARHSQELYQLAAPEPHSLSGEWTRKTISDDRNCYPAPVVVGDKIYVFYSCNDDNRYPYRTYRFIRSSDCGATWSEPVTIIDSGKNDSDKFDEVYAFGTVYEPGNGDHQGKVHLTWSMWGGPKGHAREGRGCFFASFDPSNDRMYSADGTDLGTCIDFDHMMGKCLIETAEPADDFSHTILCPVTAVDPLTGAPVVAYGYRDHNRPKGVVHAARWSGGQWSIQTIDDTTCEFRDMELNPSDGRLRIALLSGNMLVVRQSCDGGITWLHEGNTEIPFDNGAYYAPYTNFIKNHKPEVQLLLGQINWGEAFSDYSGKWSIYTVGLPCQA